MSVHREKVRMLFLLAKNDIHAKYSGSVFGIVWAFALPLVTILVFWVVFQAGFRNPPVRKVPYILWFSAAYIPWTFFTDVTTAGGSCLAEYSFLVRKIRFQVQLLPVVKLLSALFVHAFFVLFLIVMYFLYDFPPSVYHLQIIYYAFAASFLGLGLTWLLSALTVFFKDMASLYGILLQIGFWASPILWNENNLKSRLVSQALSFNPMRYVVNGYRDSLLFQCWFWEKPRQTAQFWCMALMIWSIGRVVFRKLSPFFADEV